MRLLKLTSSPPIAALLAAATLSACSSDKTDVGPAGKREPGQTDFISADGRPGESSPQNFGERAANDTNAPTAGGEQRTVEEGDIYRVNPGTRQLLNLNSYRGLQVIDFSDVAHPRIIGKVRVAGMPVEMYQVGNRAYLLLNGWRGYYGTREDIRPDAYEGGVVLAVDLSDPANPRVTSRAEVPGNIRTSRLTRGNGQEALFVVATDWRHTYVKSFTVSGAGDLIPRTELDLGGYVSEAQATPDYLLVARYDHTARQDNRSDVAVIDIRDPQGTMVLGASVLAEGRIGNKYNLDVRGNILRIVSGNSWGSAGNTNHVETFDITNLQVPVRVDHETFGDGEQLFATLFLEDKAFFVTYQRVDPFHTFTIDASGQITAQSEFVVSGWNDYFRAVAGERRLVGIGKNDQSRTQKLAVSLYEIEDLRNPNPLLAREEIDLSWAWSEGNWDDRAFSVVEDAVSVQSARGVTETGLILLPFSGWDQTQGAEGYVSGVQIFTFSESTLTKRGTMMHGTQVRRSFLADPANHTAGNLSDAELSLYDTTNPDQPAELGKIELAPNYTNFISFGTHGVRRHSKDYWFSYWRGRAAIPDDRLEVVALSGDIDADAAVADIFVPAGAALYKIGASRLAAVSTRVLEAQPAMNAQPTYETTIQLFDFSTPTTPRVLGSLTTTELPAGYGYWGWDARVAIDCWDCFGPWYGGGGNAQVVGPALVFPEAVPEQELEGLETIRSITPVYDEMSYRACWDPQTGAQQSCTYLTGGIWCVTLVRVDGTVEPETCSGAIYQCSQTANGETTTCAEVDPSSVRTTEQTYSNQRYRYWFHWDLHAVDVRGDAPALGAVVPMDAAEEAAGLLVDGNNLHVSFKRPVRIAGDGRRYVRFFFRTHDFSNPTAPVVATAVNVPGELIAVTGSTIITRDNLFGDNIVETAIDELEVSGGLAYLRGSRRFTDEWVESIRLDGVGHVLVSHRPAWQISYRGNVGVAEAGRAAGDAVAPGSGGGSGSAPEQTRLQKLSILGLGDPSLPVLSELAIDEWASLSGAIAGRAMFMVPGGLLVVNVENVAAPFAQGYFPVIGWPNDLVLEGRDVIFAAGRYGLYRFDLDAYNLLTPVVR